MNNVDQRAEYAAEYHPEALLADGFEEALLGFASQAGSPEVAVYDVGKCLEVLQDRDGMSHTDAIEFFEFNVLSAYVGRYTPIFLSLAPWNDGHR